MIPLLSIALTLISNVTDLAHMFVSDKLDDRPGLTFYFENRHEEASFALFDNQGDAQADVMKDFSHFVRCWRTGREKAMNPRTVEIVSAIARALQRRAHQRRVRISRASLRRAALEALPRPRDGHPRAGRQVQGRGSVGVAELPPRRRRLLPEAGVRARRLARHRRALGRHLGARRERARALLRSPRRRSRSCPRALRCWRSIARASRRPVDSDVELAAVQNILASSFDPLKF